MATLVNREIVVRVDGREVVGRCTAQQYDGAGWIRVLCANGDMHLVEPNEFVRVFRTPQEVQLPESFK